MIAAMRRPRRQNRLAPALLANAVALGLIGLALLLRGGDVPSFTPAASAQSGIAGSGGLYVVPGQLANNVHGVYLIDTDRQVLLVYRCDPSGGGDLKLIAARDVTHDRRLGRFNTSPDPEEIKAIADKELQTTRQRRQQEPAVVEDAVDSVDIAPN